MISSNYKKILQMKAKYDPDCLFYLEQLRDY
ncbi:uncharacterized protein METZ01_LOCUS194431 [marine metagenome]|uniref:Berberine/berberine-like domain-containing protein n=1 Tax=marine metagenome TaxID=408172 RepID=A0A382DVJ5_9ZZZZ